MSSADTASCTAEAGRVSPGQCWEQGPCSTTSRARCQGPSGERRQEPYRARLFLIVRGNAELLVRPGRSVGIREVSLRERSVRGVLPARPAPPAPGRRAGLTSTMSELCQNCHRIQNHMKPVSASPRITCARVNSGNCRYRGGMCTPPPALQHSTAPPHSGPRRPRPARLPRCPARPAHRRRPGTATLVCSSRPAARPSAATTMAVPNVTRTAQQRPRRLARPPPSGAETARGTEVSRETEGARGSEVSRERETARGTEGCWRTGTARPGPSLPSALGSAGAAPRAGSP